MGVSYHAFAVLGVKIDRSKLVTTERRKAFDHDFPDDGVTNFDPQTGQALWEDVKILINGHDADDLCSNKFGPFYCNSSGLESVEYIYIGTEAGRASHDYLCSDEDNFMIDPDEDVSEIKKRLKDYFEPLGIWDERDFGYWVVQYVGV